MLGTLNVCAHSVKDHPNHLKSKKQKEAVISQV